MWNAICWGALLGSLLVILLVLGGMNARALDQCELKHSRDTCLHAMR